MNCFCNKWNAMKNVELKNNFSMLTGVTNFKVKTKNFRNKLKNTKINLRKWDSKTLITQTFKKLEKMKLKKRKMRLKKRNK